jgi:predicted amidohydrolase
MMQHYVPILLGFGTLVLFATTTAAADRPTASAPAEPAKELRIAAVQMRSGTNLDENIKKTIDFIARCAKDGVRVVVFPECSVTGYFGDSLKSTTAEQVAGAEKRISEACKQHNVYAIVGMPWRENGKLFNSAVIISPAGKIIERYHKMRLAEAWPDPGDHLSVYKIDGVTCTTIVCHDERYPELVRLPVLVGAQIVFYISSESGLHEESKINPYRAQIQARAVENGVWVIHANSPANQDATGSHGQSRIIAPDGNLVEEASIFGEDVVTATLKVSRASRHNATRSLENDPLRSWWQQGMKLVRIIE